MNSLLIVIFTFICLVSCHKFGCSNSGHVTDLPVLKVDQIDFTVSEFSDLLARKLRYFDALSAKNATNVKLAKEEVIKELVLYGIIASWAQENNIVITEQDLENEINLIRDNYPDDIAFRNSLAAEDISFNQWKEKLRRAQLEKKIIEKITAHINPPTDNEVKEYYENNKEKHKRGEQIYLRQIFMNKENSAEEIRNRLIKGASFEEMAKQYSMASEASSGGLIGWIEKKTVDVFDKAFKLPINTISKVFESPYGYHIFKVEKHRDAGYMTLEEASPKIKRALLKDREQAIFSAWLDQQIRSIKIFRDDKLIDAISVETRND